ncbi:MAG: DNA recombination protein RmuC [Candidatus Omnitrophica bacterium]|nr:DNA recombination protein RmuC [Candidatus Omnitrophota bacterium]MCG2705174.1 DNA recombination protein RmuC [Candidatus Omnitrophota bacterium]
MNFTLFLILAGVCAVLFLTIYAFSRHIKMINSTVSEQLKEINDNLRAHFVDNSRLTQERDHHIGTRLDNTTRVVGDVKELLGRVEESSRRIFEIGKDISSLQDILRAPKIRGGIGQYFLEDLLKQILPKEYYALEYEFKSKERVDAIIRLAGGMVPVDAKFPLDNFKRILSAKEDKEREAFRKCFITDVKNHIKKISEKYILPDEGTLDFALMYIPAENVYYETIIKDENLGNETGVFQYATSKKVIPVSPSSFYAYLMVILLGLKGMTIERRAKDIMQHLARIRGEFDRFSDDFGKVGRHIDNAKSAYKEGEGHLVKISDRLLKIELPESSPGEVKKIPEK